MRFVNKTLNEQIDAAIVSAERLLKHDSPMLAEIEMKNDFAFDSGKGSYVASKLRTGYYPLTISTYLPWNPFTKVIGYYDGSSIFINLKILPRLHMKDMVANLLHEYAHHCGFTHGNNYPSHEKNLYSVPYFISSNIEKWL